MPAFPEEAFTVQCRVCLQPFPHKNAFLNHKRGANNPCKGSAPLLLLPDEVIEASMDQASALPDGEQVPAGEPFEPGKEDLFDEDGAARPASDSEPLAIAVGQNGHVSGNGTGNGHVPAALLGYIQPSATKETLFIPVAFRMAYDAMRAHREYLFEGSFNEWVLQMIDRQLYHMRIKTGITVELPPVVATAEVSHG